MVRVLGLSRADIGLAVALLIVALLTMAPTAWAALNFAGSDGESVFVVRTTDGRTILPVGRDGTYEFAGPLGTTVVEVSLGRARIASSPCAHSCWHGGWLSRAGQTSVCLPNRLVLEVEGWEASGIDGVTH